MTEQSFDAYSWQLLEQKQRFISQVMTGEIACRSAEDIDESSLSFATVKALATGNPKMLEKFEVDTEVSRLQVLKSQYANQRYRLQDDIAIHTPKKITYLEGMISRYETDIQHRDAHKPVDKDSFSMVVDGIMYTKRVDAGKRLIELAALVKREDQEKVIGSYNGFDLKIEPAFLLNQPPKLYLCGEMKHEIELGASDVGNTLRIDNELSGFEQYTASYKKEVQSVQERIIGAKAELEKPFAHEQALNDLLARQTALNIELGVGKPEYTEYVETGESEGVEVIEETEEIEEEEEWCRRLRAIAWIACIMVKCNKRR